jgi:hypothetical protein
MSGLNRATLLGNLGADPELARAQNRLARNGGAAHWDASVVVDATAAWRGASTGAPGDLGEGKERAPGNVLSAMRKQAGMTRERITFSCARCGLRSVHSCGPVRRLWWWVRRAVGAL